MEDLRRHIEYNVMRVLVPFARDWLDEHYINEWYINGSLHVFKGRRHFVVSVSEVVNEK